METNRQAELENIIFRLEARARAIEGRIKKVSAARLVVFLISIVVSFIIFFSIDTFSTISAIVFSIVLQIALSYPHNRLLNSLQRHRVYIMIKKSYINRIKLEWDKIPLLSTEENGGDSEAIDPIGVDLNITGKHSLLQLIDLTASEQGRKLLKRWLINSLPDYNEILNRQNIVKELIPLNRFRDRLLLNAKIATKKDLNINGLLNWLKLPSDILKLRKVYTILSIIAPLNIILMILGFSGIISAIWVVPVFIYVAIYFLNQNLVKNTYENAVFIKDELGKFSQLMYFLEGYNYKDNKNLRELCSPFLEKTKAPSAELKGLKGIISVLSIQKNPFIWFLLILIFPLDYFYSIKLEKYKNNIASSLPEWLEVWAKLEALISLATFSYLNPEYTFPHLSDAKPSEKHFGLKGNKVGHPLIPKLQKVTNDFTMGVEGEIAIVTGSNMSGKSTFLRSLGINVMLAYSGGPVNAEFFELPLLRIFTCIKVSDSVVDGISYFYAEVKRLRLLLDELAKEDERPVVFFIDEIFKGTNNIERLVGSRSFIKAISGRNGLGCISTHDLELVMLADEIKTITNYHFRDEVKDGKMHFDYILRNGPCPTTNALRIMESEGLPIIKN